VRPGAARAAVTLAILLASTAGCGSGAPEARPTGSPAATRPAPDAAPAQPGAYDQQVGRVRASLRFEGATAELTIANRTGGEVGAPSIEWLEADSGRSRTATVAGAAPIRAGEQASFSVDLGEGFRRDRAGLVILHLGSIAWGAFTPPAA